MDTLIQDIRFALRSLRRARAFTAVVVTVMALGIGVNVMIFSMVYGLLFRPWPLPHPDRIVTVGQTDPRRGFNNLPLSWPNYIDLRARAKSFQAFGAYYDHTAIVTLDRDPERLFAASVTADVFPAVGVRPVLGHGFSRDEEIWGRNFTQVVISDRIWRDRYHADRNVLGHTLKLNGRVREIVGVMPPGFRFPEIADFWIPAGFSAKDHPRDGTHIQGVARLAPGVTWEQANAEVASLMGAIGKEHPEVKDQSAHAHVLQDWWARGPRPIMIVMLVAVLFVLLIACANVANLMLARAATRQREIGLRLALGASRGRVIRQLLTESVVVSLIGGALGIALGAWGNAVWPTAIPLERPFFMRFDIDAPVLLYTAAITVLAGILFGLAPALHGSDHRLAETLREGSAQAGTSRGGMRLRSGLVVAEVAFSLVLLIGAGLMIRTFLRLDQAGSQLRTERIVTSRLLLPIASYAGEPEMRRFFRDLSARLEAEPGVTAFSGMVALPLTQGSNQQIAISPENADPKSGGVTVNFTQALPGCFALLGVPLRGGREFTLQDDEHAPRVAVVNESLARTLFPGREAVGQRVKFLGEPDSIGWRTVVGVVADLVQNVEDHDNPVRGVWVPELQQPAQYMTVAVEAGTVSAAGAALRRAVHAINPDLALEDLRSLREHLRTVLWVRRLFATLIGLFATMALVIAAVGLYGVMAYSVAQRTHEIGIRMALGAQAGAVRGMVVRQALRLTLLGIGIGLAGAFAMTRLMTSVIMGVSPTDPPTFVVVTVLLAISGLVAAWVPAWRATRVDPIQALRVG